MTAAHLAAVVLAGAGVLVICFCAVGALIARTVADRLHFVSPAAVVGAPLVLVGLAVDVGLGRTAAKLIFVAVLMVASAPVTAVAIARAGPHPPAPDSSGGHAGGASSEAADRTAPDAEQP